MTFVWSSIICTSSDQVRKGRISPRNNTACACNTRCTYTIRRLCQAAQYSSPVSLSKSMPQFTTPYATSCDSATEWWAITWQDNIHQRRPHPLPWPTSGIGKRDTVNTHLWLECHSYASAWGDRCGWSCTTAKLFTIVCLYNNCTVTICLIIHHSLYKMYKPIQAEVYVLRVVSIKWQSQCQKSYAFNVQLLWCCLHGLNLTIWTKLLVIN